MKYAIILAMVVCGSVGCETQRGYNPSTDPRPRNAYTVVIIEGCEYIESGTYHDYILTHKGNCSNKIHQPCTK